MTAPFRIALFALVAASAWLVAPEAKASETYPGVIEDALDTPCPPACITCHTRPDGGELTANTPFGISTRRAGLHCCNNSELLDVLATLEANGTDSDSDGTPDTEELRAGTDPNAPEGKLECYVPESDEGCAMSCRTASERGRAAWALGALFALVGIARVRRAARARQFR